MNATVLSSAQQEFLHAVQEAWHNQNLDRIIASQYQGDDAQLQKITARPVLLKNEKQITVVYRYQSKDITKNYAWEEFQTILQGLLVDCQQLNLFTPQQESQLKLKKGQWKLSQTKIKAAVNTTVDISQHNREKNRFVAQEAVFLQHLGITDAKQNIIPSMARKWKQINKFVEIFSNAVAQIKHQDCLRVVDFGSGKGYLTFALYDYLTKHQQTPLVTGVELNDKMVSFCQDVAKASEFTNLNFFQGDVRTYEPERLDVMIALHACDIATDFAIHTGIRLNAQMIMCAPCCHKELRPQLTAPKVLSPMLQFGIHAGQQAEMLTDTIRALLLKAYGYDTKVFEFVALEHTSKNKMILATKRQDFSQPDAEVLAQIQALKTMYGIEKHSLELLLNDEWDKQGIGCKC